MKSQSTTVWPRKSDSFCVLPVPVAVMGVNMKSGARSPTAGAGIACAGEAPTGFAAVSGGNCAEDAQATAAIVANSGLKRVIRARPLSVAAKIQSKTQKWTGLRPKVLRGRLRGGPPRALYQGGRMAAATFQEDIAMKNIRMLLLVPAAVLAAACGRETKTDDALKNDLALASQAQPFNPQQVTSAAE